MKKIEKEYDVDYPVDEMLSQYYGQCEACNTCNSGNQSCTVINRN